MAGASAEELDAWVLATAGQAAAYARTLLADPNDADDVVQDCYCRLLARSNVYDLPRDGLKLLYRSISNAIINLKTRRRMHRPIAAAGSGRHGNAGDADDAAHTADPPDPDALPPEVVAAGNELHAAVRAALLQLPVQQRAAVELKSLGYSQNDIADILGISPSNAGVLIHRGRQMLAEILQPMTS